MYTVSQLCRIKGKSRMNILNKLRRLGFIDKVQKIKRSDGFSEYAWEDRYKKDLQIALNISDKEMESVAENAPKTIDEKGMTLEERKKLHPLVTDERFFKTSFFPDVTLAVGEEDDD